MTSGTGNPPGPDAPAAIAVESAYEEIARAKLNLTLRVLGRRPDGYHDLESLVAFASIGDRLSLAPAGRHSVIVKGLFASALAGMNLVDKAISVVATRWPEARLGAVELEKNLPVAAGIGGGSADAAATLRLLRAANPGLGGDADWEEIALGIGSDVPVCLVSRASFMRGRGERVETLGKFPAVQAVIVNPRMPLSTADVFAALNAPPLRAEARETEQDSGSGFASLDELLDYISRHPNDLEAPARSLCPQIDRMLGVLKATHGVLAARMSGSGPTCFGLFATAADAARAKAETGALEPNWWVEVAALS